MREGDTPWKLESRNCQSNTCHEHILDVLEFLVEIVATRTCSEVDGVTNIVR